MTELLVSVYAGIAVLVFVVVIAADRRVREPTWQEVAERFRENMVQIRIASVDTLTPAFEEAAQSFRRFAEAWEAAEREARK